MKIKMEMSQVSEVQFCVPRNVWVFMFFWIVRLICKSAFYMSLWRGCFSNLLLCYEIKVGPGFAGTHWISKIGRRDGNLPLVRKGAGVLLCLLGSFIHGMPRYRQFHNRATPALLFSVLLWYLNENKMLNMTNIQPVRTESTSSATLRCFGHTDLLTLVCPLAFRCHFWNDTSRETVAAGMKT